MSTPGSTTGPASPFTPGRADTGPVEIAFDRCGPDTGRPLLLIPGLGVQRIHWPAELALMLADRGFQVIRIDNRDAGESTVLSGLGTPSLATMMSGLPTGLRYGMSDLAADAVGVLDHLGIGAAHVAGFSMGGMIAQQIAVDRPERVASLVSIMSRTGRFRDSIPWPRQLLAIMQRPPASLEDYLARSEKVLSAIGSPAWPMDPVELRQLGTEAYRRGIHPDGSARQLHAINAQRDRSRALGRLHVPALVIHGAADRLVLPRGGLHTATVIPDARLRLYAGMGHDLPRPLWPDFVDEIELNADRAA